MVASFHLADLFEAVASCVPERIAIRTDEEAVSYRDLNARADGLAAGLAAQGVKRGDTLGLYLTNSAAHVVSLIAALKVGAVPFNVNYRYQGEELADLFRSADAAVIIHDARFANVMGEVAPLVPTLKLAVQVGGTAPPHAISYEALCATPARSDYARSEDDIVLLFTGGTTGKPKGVMWPHRAFLFACAGGAGYYHPKGPITAPDDIAERATGGYPLTLYPLAPLMHGAALWAAWTALLGGLTLVLDADPRFDPEAVWSRVERTRAQLVQFVGDAMAIPLRDCLRAHPGRWDLSCVVNLGSGGAPFSQGVQADLRALVPTATTTNGTGASETGISGMAEASADGMFRLPASDAQSVVVDGRLAAVGETGFVARSGNIPVGYFGDPVKSAETFQTIGGKLWAVSGDAARLDGDGKITVFGRGSTCINTGGEKVFPEEVEEVLRSHPAVFDSVVTSVPDVRWGERVVAVLSPREDQPHPDDAELQQHVKQTLAGYKVPKDFLWVPLVVRSPAGKQDYRWAKSLVMAASEQC